VTLAQEYAAAAARLGRPLTPAEHFAVACAAALADAERAAEERTQTEREEERRER
jgi:hypothetical protein